MANESTLGSVSIPIRAKLDKLEQDLEQARSKAEKGSAEIEKQFSNIKAVVPVSTNLDGLNTGLDRTKVLTESSLRGIDAHIGIRATLDQLDKDLEQARTKAEKGVNNIADTFRNFDWKGVGLGIGAAVGAGIGVISFNIAVDSKQLTNDLQAGLGVTEADALRLGSVAKTVFLDNFGGSIGEVGSTIMEARRQLGDMSDQELASVTKNAFRLKDVFGVDTAESISAVDTLMENFGITSQQSFDFITKGFQKGFNSSGDFLDSINEYSPQYRAGGADAGQFFSAMETGRQGGNLGTDKVNDMFKEFVVRIQDGSKTTADGLKALGIDSDDLTKKMASGQVTAAAAYQMVTDRLREQTDLNVRQQAGVALLGTQYEDMGSQAALAIDMNKTKMEDLEGATGKLDIKYRNLGAVIEGLKRSAEMGLKPVGDMLLDLANNVAPKIENAFMMIGSNMATVTPLAIGLGAAIGAAVVPGFLAWAASAAAAGIATLTALAPILVPLALIGGAVALLGLAWSTNFLGIQELLTNVWTGTLEPIFSGIGSIIQNQVMPVLGALANVGLALLESAFKEAANVWDTALKPAFDALGEKIEPIMAALRPFADFIRDRIIKHFEDVARFVNDAVNALNSFANAVRGTPPVGTAAPGGNPGGLPEGYIPPQSLPAYHSGTPYVPYTGLAVLHRGEAVIPAGQNNLNSGVNINVTVANGAVQVSGNAPGNMGQMVGDTIAGALEQLAKSAQRLSTSAPLLQPGNPG